MIWIYRVLFLPLLLVTLPYYLRRMLKRGGYARDFHHRFGFLDRVPAKPTEVKRIWIQAVSVGELLAAAPLLESLHYDAGIEVVLTTTTSTGYSLARKRYKEMTTALGVFPLDFWPCSSLAWRRVDPDLVILLEGELWPEHMHQARVRDVPILLVNARLSDRSYKRYRKAPGAAWLLRQPAAILASTRQDLERFVEIGTQPENVTLTGNLKFDVRIGPELTPGEVRELRREMGFYNDQTSPDPLVILGSSTWPGEEEALLETLTAALDLGIDCRLLLVPRHAERRSEIETLLQSRSHPCHFRSRNPQAPNSTLVYVGDTTGELKILTQAADLAFIGKSLPPHCEGQTPIEAAALGKPLLFGPGMSNFKDISRSLLKVGAARQTPDAKSLKENMLELLQDAETRKNMAEASRSWHKSNQGAVTKTLAAIRRFL